VHLSSVPLDQPLKHTAEFTDSTPTRTTHARKQVDVLLSSAKNGGNFSRVEDGLPHYGKLWEEPSEEERRRYMEERKKRVASYND
jgi:hypothetical protein